ncbi:MULTISPECIES: hypothetical protein [Stenotrophomonas]|uniref:hypothetical protein n=1 Tax=Stenotrophomonas TaxID=40323 RepID=UPI000D0DB6F9|nr:MULTISPECIES: hypothetical protein [Stenotrophomonas]EMB2833611.1 hypothetical protein [Stenotrophomonas maltophilia]MBH1452951.1 hypothetical protein [Stenotrophomonas maltophilia]MBH1567469.1 hypothetical protein [Stenotrophomonas maltophilia]MBH1728597.1 hypothetical protein [Stenotrophomonas maltophilia]MBK5592880.1 hypothetical protein [Stenotrophomonas maltophilia]
MTASGNPPPLPHQTLAQLQLVSHLQTLSVLFHALAGFHWVAAVAFLGLSGWVAHSRGLDDAWMLASIHASIALLATVLGFVQLRTARQLSQRTGLAWCQRAAWLGVLAGPLGMALTAYAWVFLSKPEMAALFDRGDHLSV